MLINVHVNKITEKKNNMEGKTDTVKGKSIETDGVEAMQVRGKKNLR